MKALFFAEKMSNYITQGVNLSSALEKLQDIKDRYCLLPSEEERKVFIQPESLAAVISFAKSRKSGHGIYGIVDIGAGTTDITFFRLFKLPKDPVRIEIYASKSYILGCDDIDKSLFDLLKADENLNEMLPNDTIFLLNTIRRSKEHMKENNKLYVLDLGISPIGIPQEEIEKVLLKFFEKLKIFYINTWGEAYSKEKYMSHWKAYGLFVIGGGSRIGFIRKKLEYSAPYDNIDVYPLDLEIPDDVAEKYAENLTVTENYDFLSIAHGLSFHKGKWPEIKLPSNVEPLVDIYQYREPQDRDKLYPK